MTTDRHAAEALLNAAATPCGLNGDWSVNAWHFGTGAEANRTSGDVYVIDAEDSAGTYIVLRRWYRDDVDGGLVVLPLEALDADDADGNDVIVDYFTSTDAAAVIEQAQRLARVIA